MSLVSCTSQWAQQAPVNWIAKVTSHPQQSRQQGGKVSVRVREYVSSVVHMHGHSSQTHMRVHTEPLYSALRKLLSQSLLQPVPMFEGRLGYEVGSSPCNLQKQHPFVLQKEYSIYFSLANTCKRDSLTLVKAPSSRTVHRARMSSPKYALRHPSP